MRTKINVFEGARRIALLAGVAWGIGTVSVQYNDGIEIPMRLVIAGPNATPVRVPMAESYPKCTDDEKWDEASLLTSKKSKIEVNFCFKQMDFPTGRLVPYKIDPNGQIWGSGKYSTEVTDYVDRVKRGFRLTKADEEWADSRYWPMVWKKINEGSKWLFGGWFALWVFTATVGWIVRGFTGIPSGQDHRPEISP